MAMLFATAVLLLPVAVVAQSFWLNRSPNKTLGVEIFKPRLYSGVDNGVSYPVDYSFQTAAFFLSLRWPVGKKTFLVAELPFAHAAFDKKIDRPFSFYRNNGRESTFGNPYIGLERGSLNSRFFAEIGLRLPLAKTDNNYAAGIGRAADRDREESFEHLAAIRALINYRSKRTHGLTFRARGGALVQRDFDHLSNNYFSFPIHAQVGYETAHITIGIVNLVKISLIDEYRSNFKMNQVQNVGLTGSVRFSSLRLGVCLPGLIQGSERAFSFLDFDFSSFGLNLSFQR